MGEVVKIVLRGVTSGIHRMLWDLKGVLKYVGLLNTISALCARIILVFYIRLPPVS